MRRVGLLEEEGIEFLVNANVGVNVDAQQLKSDHDAVVLAAGSTEPRDLPVPGGVTCQMLAFVCVCMCVCICICLYFCRVRCVTPHRIHIIPYTSHHTPHHSYHTREAFRGCPLCHGILNQEPKATLHDSGGKPREWLG